MATDWIRTILKFIKENWFVMMIGAIVSSFFTQLYLAWCKHNFPKELPAIKDLIAILVVLIIFKEIENKMSEFEKEIAHIDFNLLRIFACYKKARKKVVDIQSSIGFNDKINIINISKLKEINNYFEVFLSAQLDNNKLR